MTVTFASWDGAELGRHGDEVLEVYAEAMEVSWSTARSRRSVLSGHLTRHGLQARAALQGDQLVGIAYGYLGQRGQWWHDQVREALASTLADVEVSEWLDGSFEVCELHVRPALHGTGVGRTLLTDLLAQTSAPTALLTTPDRDTRARRFYRAGGWTDLVRGLVFPGDPRVFAVLGLRL